MKTDTVHYLPSFLGKLGFLFAGIGTLAIMERFPGLNWWFTQPLWLVLLPLVAGPLLGFVVGHTVGRRVAGR